MLKNIYSYNTSNIMEFEYSFILECVHKYKSKITQESKFEFKIKIKQ